MSAYKDTLQLPRTEFPMKASLTEREPAWLECWQAQALYKKIQAARADGPAYILHDGPPFANGDVHMGTALNKVLKDLVIKSKTMAGYRAPFVPGWDCHGLPIEFKVVKAAQGLRPEEVRERSEACARRFIDVQREQFKRLGVFGDWDHPYLTLDPAYEADILRAFAVFVEKGLVYRSRKPVLWSYGAHTALAEAEVEYKEKISPAVFVRFRAQSGVFEGADFVIWTTTPWTLPANLAIALHPSLSYVKVEIEGAGTLVLAEGLLASLLAKLGNFSHNILQRVAGGELAGSKAGHPFLDREATVFTADFVTLETGTGLVHIAPGHGDDDYQLGMAHGLDLLSPVDDQGNFTQECGVPSLVGQNVFAANPAIVSLLGERGALLLAEEHRHSYPHCWRSKKPVIFRAVEQFFIRIDTIRDAALEAVDSADWIPHWGRNRIRGTVESRPDWCISRQRTWGVPLPIFYTAGGEPVLDAELIRRVAEIIREHGTNAWFAWEDAGWNSRLNLPADTTRRLDTLDVWIDSGVSHMAVLDRHPELHAPADLYLEATDQHRGWFQSSLMTSVALRNRAPYRCVLTHGFVVDMDTREKISKSGQGGYQKPTDAAHYVNKYGADLVRLWVCSVNFTDDVPFSEEIFTRLSDAYRRLRNTLRILLGNLHDFDPSAHKPAFGALPEIDRWILAELEEVKAACLQAYSSLEFYKVYQILTQFCAVELSSQYIDITKDRLYCDRADSPRRRATQTAMHEIFESLCCLLAPIICFTSEEAWSHRKGAQPGDSVHLQLFPAAQADRTRDSALERVRGWINLRATVSQGIEAATRNGVIGNPLQARIIVTAPGEELDEWKNLAPELEEFLISSELEFLAAPPGIEISVKVEKTTRTRCERCWRHREDVGSSVPHPTLCGRCAEAVG